MFFFKGQVKLSCEAHLVLVPFSVGTPLATFPASSVVIPLFRSLGQFSLFIFYWEITHFFWVFRFVAMNLVERVVASYFVILNYSLLICSHVFFLGFDLVCFCVLIIYSSVGWVSTLSISRCVVEPGFGYSYMSTRPKSVYLFLSFLPSLIIIFYSALFTSYHVFPHFITNSSTSF